MGLEGTTHLISAVYRVNGWNLYKRTVNQSGKVVSAAYKQQAVEGNKAITRMKGFTTQTIKGKQVIKPFYNETHKAAKAVKQMGSNMNTTKGKTNDLMKALKRAAIVAPVWLALRAVMMKTIQLFKSSVKFLIDWEKQMAQIKIVGKGTVEEYNRLSTSLLNLATAYGISIDQLGAGAKLWAQQGKSIAEIIPLMETTIKMSLLTGRTVERSVEDLTAIMKNFGIEANNTEQILDSITNVMLNHAITADTLVAAYKDVASIAATVGVSFDKLTGLITATHIATRAAGSRVGKAWITIFTRMGTSAVTAIQKIAQVPAFIDKLGVASFKSTGILRPMGDVLDEIASKWHTLGSELQVQLAYAIAGRRRLQLFTAAMMQYEEGLKATLHSLDSFGKGQAATNILLATAAAKTEQLKNAWNSLVDTLATTEGFKTALDGLKEMIQHLERMSKYGNLDLTSMFPTTPKAGAAYDYAKKTEKIRKEETRKLDKQTANYKSMTTLSAQLLALLTSRNRLLKSGVDLEDAQIKKLEEYITMITTGLGKKELFIDITTIPLDSLAEHLEKLSPELEEKLISAQAVADIKKRKDAILYETNDLVVKYNQRIEKMKSSIPVFVEEPSTVPMEALKKVLEEIEGRLAKAKDFAKIPFFGNEKQVIQHEAIKSTFEDIIKSREKLNELGEDAINIRKHELRETTRLAKEELILRDKKEEFDEDMYELKKKIIKQDIQELESIQEKIKLYEEYGTVLGDAAEKTVQSLQLQEMTLQKKEIESITKALANHEMSLAKLRGASASQLAEMNLEYGIQLGYADNSLALLKNQLNLEKEITKEKLGQTKLSSETVKLYEIAEKYGYGYAETISRYLQGKSQYIGGEAEMIMKKEMSSRYVEKEAERKIRTGIFRSVRPEEEYLTPGYRPPTPDIAEIQKRAELPKMPTAMPKVDISTTIQKIEVKLPEGSLENMASNVGETVKQALLTDEKYQKDLMGKLRKFA